MTDVIVSEALARLQNDGYALKQRYDDCLTVTRALAAVAAREQRLREAALWVRGDSQQDGRDDPFGSQGPAITVGGNAYEALVAALDHITQDAARAAIAADAEAIPQKPTLTEPEAFGGPSGVHSGPTAAMPPSTREGDGPSGSASAA